MERYKGQQPPISMRHHGYVLRLEDPLGANLNVYPFFLAQGAAAAIAIALMSGSVFVRYSLFGIIALGFIASFLPVSRGGTAAVLITCMAVVLAYVWADRGASFPRFIRIMAVILGLGMCMLLWVPQAVFSRFSFPPLNLVMRMPLTPEHE